jgi:hypothetical protein
LAAEKSDEQVLPPGFTGITGDELRALARRLMLAQEEEACGRGNYTTLWGSRSPC